MLYNRHTGRLRILWKLLAFSGVVLLAYFVVSALAFLLRVGTPRLIDALVFPLLIAVAVLLISWMFLRGFEHQPIGAIGIGWDRPWGPHIVAGALAGAGLLGAAWLVFWLCDWTTSGLRPDLSGHVPQLIVAAFVCLAVAVSEELLCRGYAFQMLARCNMSAAVVLTGAFYVAIHVPNKGGAAPVVALNMFLAHLLYVACYLRTRSLWLPVGLHASWNFAEAFVFGMPLSGGTPTVSIFTTDLSASPWVGNEFGPEGGVVVTLLLALATAAAWLLIRQRAPALDLLAGAVDRDERRVEPPAPQLASTGPDLRPAPQSRRILGIDVLRGVAILGILPMNIQVFATIDGAFINPYAGPWTDNVNVAVWVFQHVLIGHKDLAVFSMLFGVGIVMIDARCRAMDRTATELHYRRMAVLLVIGLLHAYLIWAGDILFTLAVCGCIVYICRNLRPVVLFSLGVLAYAVPMCLLLVAQWALPRLPEDMAAQIHTLFQPTAEQIAEYHAAYGGGWLQQMGHRAPAALGLQTVLLAAAMGWVVVGMMLLGMGFYKLGVFSAELPSRWYWAMMAAAVFVGLPLILFGLHRNFAANWAPEYSFFGGRVFSECAFPIMAIGWIGLVMLVCKHGKLTWLTGPLSAVGRMALTNYLMHSVICSLVFYGHGFGMVGKVDRVGQLSIAVSIWILQLVYSPLWLRRYRFGPVEWLWRSMTYGRAQPMRIVT